MTKRIGIIIISIALLLGIFIVPIHSAIIPQPNYLFAVDGNLLTNESASATNCTVVYNAENDRLQLTTSGNGQQCRYFINAGLFSISLAAGTYSFGLLYSESPNNNLLRLVVNSNGSENLETTRQDLFTLDRPSLLQALIVVPASENTSVKTINFRPYLIYSNDSIGSISGAFREGVTAPFMAIGDGFNYIANSIIGVDGKITPFGVLLVFIISVPLVTLFGSMLISLLTRPFKKRR